MTLTPADVESLTTALSRWEVAEYLFAGCVALACLGEYAADFTNWFTGGVEGKKRALAKRSTLLLVASLALELVCLVKTNALSGELVGSLAAKAEEANERSGHAIADSNTAIGQSKTAAETSALAKREAGDARDLAAKAETLAQGARQEADTFERRLGSAETKADEAESHLAEALRRATEATAELGRLKSPRSLTDVPKLVATLTELKGTEYQFASVFMDEESVELLKNIDGVLQRAGWKRVPITSWALGIPTINVSVADSHFTVLAGLEDGVRVSVDSLETLSVLNSLPFDKRPALVRKATSLNIALSSSLFPPARALPVNIDKGTSQMVRIAIGKKP